eukprot:SAG11_NODE_7294_length_1165_cov_1.299250_3_plen_27_part_01
MFFIIDGTVEVVDEKSGTVLGELTSGD